MARLPGRNGGASGQGGRGGGRGGREGILQGLALLGRFQKEGFGRFEASSQGLLASLAPWIAFLLVGGALLALQGKPVDALTDVAVLTCWLLVPPAVSQAVASAFRRDDRWLRYATATTWCEWLMVPVYAVALFLVSLCMEAGLPPHAAPFVLIAVIGVYWLCLHVFLARAGLDLTTFRAVLLVVAVIAGYGVVFAAAHAVGGPAAALFGV